MGPITLNLRARTAHLGAVQWLTLVLVLMIGVALLFAADTSGGVVRAALREGGIVTVGTVFVTLLYDVAVRPVHDAHLLNVVRDSLVGRARDYGLTGIERVDFAGLFRRLEAGDELWWLDTYCPDLDSPAVQDALRAAAERGAAIRMLVIDPESDTAEARAHEIDTRGYQTEEFQKDARHNLNIIQEIKAALAPDVARARRLHLLWTPLRTHVLARADGRAIEGWTSYFLTIPTYEAAHLYWGQPSSASRELPAGKGLGLQAFRTYFEKKWAAARAENLAAAQAEPERVLTDTKVTLERLRKRHYTFVLRLMTAELERALIKPGKKVLSGGKLRHEQTSETRDLVLELAEGAEILLIHSTSENAIFEDVSFWRPFNEQLHARVTNGQLAGLRRLFVLEAKRTRCQGIPS